MSDAVIEARSAPARGVAPASTPSRRDDWLVNQLPAGMLGDDFFVRLVRIFQEQAQTLVAHADSLPHLADPQLAPIEMVRYMARWLGTEGIDDSYGPIAQRAVLRMVAETLPWRGTRFALTRLLELYTGGPATIIDGGGVYEENRVPDDVAWVRLEVTSTGPLPTEDFIALVLDEVPAHVRTEIVIAGTLVWPPAPTRTSILGARAPGDHGNHHTDGGE